MPNKLKLLLFGDLHYTDTAPISREETYPKDILRKLVECIVLAKKLKCDFIGCTGDFFHRKSSATFHEAITLMSIMKKSPIPFVGVGGNHDYTGYNKSTINKRALGTLVASGHLRLLDDNPIESGGILVTGSSFSSTYDVDRVAYVKPEQHEKFFTLAVTHGTLELTENGSFWGNYTNMSHLRALEYPLHDIIFNGHRHDDQGIFELKDRDCTVFSTGSLARNILKEDVAKRKPKATYIEIKDGEFSYEEIELKTTRKFSSAFIIPETINDEQSQSIREFVDVLSKESGELNIASDRNLVKKLIKRFGYKKEVEMQVLDYLENSEEYAT